VFEKLPVDVRLVRAEENAHSPFLGRRFPCSTLAEALKEDVQRGGGDFGAAFDFEGQRVAFFDERGSVLRHDVAAAMIATELLAQNPEACITYDLRATATLRARIASCGGQPVSAPASALAFGQHCRRNEALYGADLTGLHYFRGFFGFPSPIVALLVFASHVGRAGRAVSRLVSELDKFSRSEDMAIPIPSAEMGDSVLGQVHDHFSGAERELIDGVTVRLQDYWFNLRQPGKASELRLTVEGRTSREERKGAQAVQRLVQEILAAPK
jgi:phosphomannomutase